MRNVVIIGASHAAAEAISTLRRSGWKGGVTLIGDESRLPYQRPPLSKGYYDGDVSAEKLELKKAEFYSSESISLKLGCRAISINRRDKKVDLMGGESVSYDKVIIATGTRARKLEIEGADLHEVKYLRTLQDVDDIKQQLAPKSKLLIIGAGYIGLEVAASAVKGGVNVTVIEAMDRVLARVTSPIVSEFYQTMHAQAGVDIRLQTSLVKFEKVDGKCFAVLASKERIAFDCAIVGIGVVPNVELAEGSGLACDNGITVNEFTQTSDPDIYAVGDCSNHPSFIYGRRIRLESVPNAVAQAKTAANDLCGKRVAYNQIPWFWSDQYDVKLQTAGLIEGYDELLIDGDPKGKKFSVAYFKNGRMIALDAVNSPASFMKAKKRILQESDGS